MVMSLAEPGTKNKCAGEGLQQINRPYPTPHTTSGPENKNYCAREGQQQINKPDRTPMQTQAADLITGNQNSDGILVGPVRLQSHKPITYGGRNGERKKRR